MKLMDSPLGGSDRQTVHDLAVPSARQHGSVTEPSYDELLNVTCVRLSCLGEECDQRNRPKLPQGGLP